MYWDEKIETMPYEEKKKLQSERLINTVRRMYDNTPYYREKMDEAGVKPEDIKSVDDLSKLPFTYKTDLRDNYPFGTFAVPLSEVSRIHASSGTTGKQTVVGYTENDIDAWADLFARALNSVGIGKDDIIHISYGYGLFTGGLGAHYGAERVGATVVPASTGNTKRQITLLMDFKATVLCCTPSYAIYIADELRAMGYSKDDLHLKYGIFGAEPWTEEMRHEIEEKLGIVAYDIYGLSETMGPGVSMNCPEKDGLHIADDHFIAEIINPETGEVLPDGEEGELVFSCITKEALPLLRYRTKDLSRITHERCKCGRTSTRMAKILGRADDMLIIRGVNVFPSQIESVILGHKELEPYYRIIVDRENSTDTCEIQVEINPTIFSDEVKGLEKLERKLKSEIVSTLGIAVDIHLVEYRSLERSMGKSVRVEDRRKLY